jgi:hypothetical protein
VTDATTWASVASHVQDWYDGLIDTSEVYRNVRGGTTLSQNAAKMAGGVVGTCERFAFYGFPVIQVRSPSTAPLPGLGTAADSVYRRLEKTHQALMNFYPDFEYAMYDELSPDQFEIFEAHTRDISSRISDLSRLNSEAMQTRTQAWRTEVLATIPEDFRETCGYETARVTGYAVCRLTLELFHAGVPADYMRMVVPWTENPSLRSAKRVLDAYNDGIPAEYARELL